MPCVIDPGDDLSTYNLIIDSINMKKTCMLAALAASLIDSAEAGISLGECPANVNRIDTLDIEQYGGVWYEYTRDSSIPFEFGSSCVTATYGATFKNATHISVQNRAYYWPLFFVPYMAEGAAKCYVDEGRCAVSFSNPVKTEIPPNYNVLHTDYTNYSIVYSCFPMLAGLAKWEQLWVLSRTPYLAKDKYDEAVNIIERELPDYNNWQWRHFTWQGDMCDYKWGTYTIDYGENTFFESFSSINNE